MASTEQLSKEILSAIANGVSPVAAISGLAVTTAAPMEVAETFRIWHLPASAVIEADPLERAKATGQWHHQLFHKGKAKGFARSMPEGPNPKDWRITSVFESPIAADIEAAIAELDSRFDDANEVRFLSIPAYQMHAFWVLTPDGNQVVPVSFPAAYRTIVKGRPYSSKEFFSELVKLRHIEGIQGP